MQRLNKGQFLRLLEQRVVEYKTNKNLQTNNPFYKFAAEKLGFTPWKTIIPIALITGFALVFIFRGSAVQIVNFLQQGF